MKDFLVSISCITYNHAPYIRECLDSFLMQKTSFAFEIIIHDDASTDGTKEIIEEYTSKYPDIIFPLYQNENQYSKGVRGMMARFNFPRCKGKYIALCEGDDYWTDPLKLQKQVDFLEANNEYSIVSGGYISKDIESNFEKMELLKNINQDLKGFDIDIKLFLKQWVTKTLTVVFKKDCIDFNRMRRFKYLRDVHIYYYLLKAGKGYYMSNVLGVYNKHAGGIFSRISEENKYVSYLNTYGELYKSNKSDLHIRNKYYSILDRVTKDELFPKKQSKYLLEMLLISLKMKDIKNYIKFKLR